MGVVCQVKIAFMPDHVLFVFFVMAIVCVHSRICDFKSSSLSIDSATLVQKNIYFCVSVIYKFWVNWKVLVLKLR